MMFYLAGMTILAYTYYPRSSRSGWMTVVYIAIPLVLALGSGIYAAIRRSRSGPSDQAVNQMLAKGEAKKCARCGWLVAAASTECPSCGSPVGPAAPLPGPKPFPRMKGEIETEPGPGPIRTVTHQIVIDGQVAFSQGDLVEVETVSPDAARPEYRYVVTSKTLNQKYLLSDNDLSN